MFYDQDSALAQRPNGCEAEAGHAIVVTQAAASRFAALTAQSGHRRPRPKDVAWGGVWSLGASEVPDTCSGS